MLSSTRCATRSGASMPSWCRRTCRTSRNAHSARCSPSSASAPHRPGVRRERCWPEWRQPSVGAARGGFMTAVDDLTELVERAAVAEKSALASKWKDEADVQALISRTRRTAEEQRQAVTLDTDPDRLSPRWAGLRQNYLDLGP